MNAITLAGHAPMFVRTAGRLAVRGVSAAGLLALPLAVSAQVQQADTVKKDAKPYNPPPMYAEVKPIAFTLHAPFGKLKRDRAEQTDYRPGYITYTSDSGAVRIPVRMRTRGIWRKKNCEIPPLMLNFTNDSTKKTAFARLDRARFTHRRIGRVQISLRAPVPPWYHGTLGILTPLAPRGLRCTD